MATIIINEFLTFVQNKIDVLDELSLIQICVTNFTEAEIDAGKDVLYTNCANGARNILRKGDDKRKKNVRDVIKVLKEVDPDVQPIFVAKDLSRLPPVSFDHIDVTRLLKDMTTMRTNFLEFQTKMSAEISEMKSAINVRDRRQEESMTTPKRTRISAQSSSSTNSLPLVPAPQHESRPVVANEVVHTPMYRDIVVDGRQSRQANVTRKAHGSKNESRLREPSVNNSQVPLTGSKDNDTSFTVVTRKKRYQKKVNMRGTRETTAASTKILVAEPKCYVYVSRTQKNVTEDDILGHISEMGQKCLKVERLQQHYETDFNSFKVTIMGSQLSTFLDGNFWPAGLVYRRYREIMSQHNAKTKPNYG